MERLLVTGFDRPLGANLALALADRYEVLGLSCEETVESPGIESGRCRPGDSAALDVWIKEWQPQWVLHCPALAAASWEPAPANLADGEAAFVAHLAESTAQTAAQLTVVGSDAVLAGPRMFHEESAQPVNSAPRAVQQRNMERALETTGALVVRTHAYGWSPTPSGTGFAQQIYEQLLNGTMPAVDGQRYATPILATDLAESLHRAYELRLHGLYHMAGAERTSPWGFAAALASALGLQMPFGRHAYLTGQAAECHEETSLNSKRARRMLEAPTPMLREGLYRFVSQAQDGWRNRWRVAGQPAQMAA